MRLLLLEDEPGMVQLIRETCIRNGLCDEATFFHEETLHAGGNRAGQIYPDVILLDLGLKDSKPHETVEGSHHLCQMFPVVVITGYDNPEFWRQMIHNGASDYLFKGAFLARGNDLFFAHAVNTAFYRGKNRHGRA